MAHEKGFSGRHRTARFGGAGSWREKPDAITPDAICRSRWLARALDRLKVDLATRQYPDSDDSVDNTELTLTQGTLGYLRKSEKTETLMKRV